MGRRWLLLSLAAALAAVSVGEAWRRIAVVPGVDYYAAWAAARAVAQGRVDDPWSADGRTRMGLEAASHLRRPDVPPRELAAATVVLVANQGALPTAGTPFFFTVLGTLSTGDYEADYVFFSLAALILYVAAVLTLCSLLGYPAASSLLALAFLTGLFSPYLSGERVGNVNTAQLAILAALPVALTAKRRTSGEVGGGVLLGLGVAFKPNLLPIVLPLFTSLAVRRHFRSVAGVSAGMAFGGLLAILSSSLYSGRPGCWLAWTRILPELLRPDFGVAIGNFSLATVIRELTGLDVALPLLGGALGAFAVFEWRRASRSARPAPLPSPDRRIEVVAILGLGGALLLCTARLAWLHYFLFLVPLVLFVLRPSGAPDDPSPSRRERALAMASLIGFLPTLSLAPSLPPVVQALSVNASLLAVTTLALRILWRSGPSPLAAPAVTTPG